VAVIRQGLTLVCIGLLFDTVAALIGARFIESSSDYFARQILHGVACNDASTFGLTVLVLVVSALIACWIPARRAASIDPIVALRQ
jgi:putative ABC transport system permease protein